MNITQIVYVDIYVTYDYRFNLLVIIYSHEYSKQTEC